MEIEVELSPAMAVEEFLELSRIVDDARVSKLRTSHVVLFRDSSHFQVLCATATRNVRIECLVTNR